MLSRKMWFDRVQSELLKRNWKIVKNELWKIYVAMILQTQKKNEFHEKNEIFNERLKICPVGCLAIYRKWLKNIYYTLINFVYIQSSKIRIYSQQFIMNNTLFGWKLHLGDNQKRLIVRGKVRILRKIIDFRNFSSAQMKYLKWHWNGKFHGFGTWSLEENNRGFH